MAEIIADRPIYASANGIEIRVLVRLFAPEVDDRANWSCRYSFETGDDSLPLKDGAVGGVDSIQAIVLALQGIGFELDKSGIEWFLFPEAEDQGDGILPRLDDGFPRPGLDPGMLGSAFRKRMEAYVTKEREDGLEALVNKKRHSKFATP